MKCFICSESQPSFYLSFTDEGEEGDKVVLQRFNQHPKQLFCLYNDYILSCQTQNCISSLSTSAEGEQLVSKKFENDPSQFLHFTPEGYIKNNNGLILTVRHPVTEGSPVILSKLKESTAFKWRVVTMK